ncbi:MAG: lactonase family protein [Armatimonadetes bacterium]|nr:lactonase family protein [Armatimonadota bacterium]
MSQPHTIYLGTYSGPQSQGIYRCTLDERSGQLSVPVLVAEAKNPTFLALSPNGRTLDAVSEAEGSAVGAWSIGADGTLSALGYQSTGGGGGCHLSVDATGKTVLVANYGSGSVAAFPTRADGSLGERSAFIQHTGSGPDLKRQSKPHAHAIYVDEANRFAYSCDLGTDQVLIYRLDTDKSSLTPADPPFESVPPGAGPRHLAFHPAGYAYVNNEMGLSVTAFKRDPATGALTAMQTIPTLPDGAPTEGVSTAEIWVHPTGRWLYVSNRGRDTITTFDINAQGRLTWTEETSTPRVPRGFGLSPDGRWLVVGGQKDNRVAAFRIDQKTGKLTPSGQPVEVGAPVCVVFAAPPSR